MKTSYLDRYELDDDPARLRFSTLEKWLSRTYWSPGIGAGEIRKGAVNSTLNVGCYLDAEQVGYLRLVSDKTRFAYFMDVYVETSHRGKGITQRMMRFAMEHPELADVYLWLLATRDAHGVYRKAGFEPLPEPENWMILRREKIRPQGQR